MPSASFRPFGKGPGTRQRFLAPLLVTALSLRPSSNQRRLQA
jgi:hypothetical protein